MNTASGEQSMRLASVPLGIGMMALAVLIASSPCHALCGDGDSPPFVLNTCDDDGSYHVTVIVTDAFIDLPVRSAYVQIFVSPGRDECVAEGPAPAGGRYEIDLPAGTYKAWVRQSAPAGYRARWSDPFDCPRPEEPVEVRVKLQTKTVVLVHGWTGDKDCWSNTQTTDWKWTLEHWTDGGEPWGYRVETPDMPGTNGVPGTQSLEYQAESLIDQIQSYGVESVYIVAHSFGGLVARYCSEGPLKDHVVRVFTLATPNHGSPLAPTAAGAKVIKDTFCADPSLDFTLTALRYLMRFHETFGAVKDLVPNCKALRDLNQGENGPDDWKTGKCKDVPNDELLVECDLQYCTITATKAAPGIYRAGGKLLTLASCDISDGVVPWASAPLWADGDDYNNDRVRNYWDTMIDDGSHHLGRTDPVGIIDNVAIRDFVVPLLKAEELPPSHWIPGGGRARGPCPGCDRQGGWVALPLLEGEIEGAASVVETLAVEPTDSLSVMFSWFEGNVFMRVEDPEGAFADTSSAIIDRDYGFILYDFTDPEPGLWKFHVDSQAGTPLQHYTVIPLVVSDTTLDAEIDPASLRPGQSLTLRATVSSAGVGIPGAAVTATVLGPLGAEDDLVLYDDGAHDDGAPDDGVYGAAYVAMNEGPYVAMADMTLAAGRSWARDSVSRQAFAASAAVDSLDLAVVPGSTQVVESTQFVDVPCHIVTAVTNLGVATCDSVRVVVDLEGASAMLADTLFALAPGQTEQLEVQLVPAAACTHVVHVRVRPADGRADENSDNDEATITFLPQVGIPNLTIDSVVLSNPNPAPGEEITADIVVLCNNTARSTGTFVDVYYDLDQPPVVDQRGDQQIYIQPLMPGESFTLTSQPFSYGSDDYFNLYFQVDPEDRCAESDETDNIYSTGVVTGVNDQGTAFVAGENNGRVRLQWVVPALDEITGFTVHRGLSADGPFARVNEAPIAPCSPCEFEDVTVWPGTEFWYELHGLVVGGGEEVLAGPISIRTEGVLSFGLAVARPNPTSQDTWFALDVPRDCTDARLEIYDVSGRLVRVVTDGPTTKGRHTVRWDLADASGHPVAAGVYFARASAEGWTGTRKVVVVR